MPRKRRPRLDEDSYERYGKTRHAEDTRLHISIAAIAVSWLAIGFITARILIPTLVNMHRDIALFGAFLLVCVLAAGAYTTYRWLSYQLKG